MLASSFRRLSRYICFVYPAVVLFAVAPLIQLAFFSHPSADDFCAGISDVDNLFALLSRAFSSVTSSYARWSGAYSAIAFQHFFAGLIDFTRFYPVIPLVFIGLTVLCLLCLVRVAFAETRFTLASVLIAITSSALYLVTMPTLPQGIYWFTAVASYHLGNLALVLVIILLFRLMQRDKNMGLRSKTFIGLGFMLPIAVGFNEPTMLTLLALMVGITVREFFYQGRQRIPLLILSILTLIFVVIYVTAPGNYVRAEHFPMRYDLSVSISHTIHWSLRYIGGWVVQPLLWLATLIIILCFTLLPAKNVACQRPNKVFIFLFLPIALLFLVALFFPAHWGTGNPIPRRTVNVIYFDFLLLWFWYCFILYRSWLAFGRWTLSLPRFRSAKSWALALVLVLYPAMVYVHPAMRQARLDLVGGGHAFHATNHERYRILEAHRGTDTDPVVVPAYSQKVPATIYFDNLTGNPSHWINTCASRYFGVKSIRVGS